MMEILCASKTIRSGTTNVEMLFADCIGKLIAFELWVIIATLDAENALIGVRRCRVENHQEEERVQEKWNETRHKKRTAVAGRMTRKDSS